MIRAENEDLLWLIERHAALGLGVATSLGTLKGVQRILRDNQTTPGMPPFNQAEIANMLDLVINSLSQVKNENETLVADLN